MFIKAIRKWVKNNLIANKNRKGVKLSFINASSVPIMLMRVIISNNAYEFKDLKVGNTETIWLKEMSTSFFAYVITSKENLFYRPPATQLEDIISHGKVKIHLYIEKDSNGKGNLILVSEKK